MTNADYTVEDCLEFLTNLTLLPGKHWRDKPFNLFPENQKVLYSIGSQVYRGKPLTEKQHQLVKKLMLEFYTDQFDNVGIDITQHVDRVRCPYRVVDKSYWVRKIKKQDKEYISIRFPFSNSVIEHINDLKKDTDSDYFYDKHIHNFLWSEINVYKVMNIANKFKEYFEVDDEVQEYYNTLVQFDLDQYDIIPSVKHNKFVNVPDDLRQYLEKKFPNIENSIVSIWDKRRLYGLHHFDPMVNINEYSTLSQKILNRENSNLVIRSDVWSINQVLSSLYEIERFPIIVGLDGDNNPLDDLSIVYNATKGFIDNRNISVMFRLDNKTNKEFNQFIQTKGLNNSVDDNTQIVIVNRKKITKPILRSNWKPVCMLTFGQSRGYGTIFSTYIEQFDLKVYYTKEDSIISQYTKRDKDYVTGVTTL